MMKAPNTKLSVGIFVRIDDENLSKLMTEHAGFLSREAYPDFYEEIAVEDEVGRFNVFRFLKMEK